MTIAREFAAFGCRLDAWTEGEGPGLLALAPAVIVHEVEKRSLYVIPKPATTGVGPAEVASDETQSELLGEVFSRVRVPGPAACKSGRSCATS